MIKDEVVKKLMQISTPKTFKANEYICYEGQPGGEMYIVLRGIVGVYVSNAMSEQTEIARIAAGDFIGEMSLFDNLPRSASCIALEDVICVSIIKEKLGTFLAACPEMALMMLENMSSRIRRLNTELYKIENSASDKECPPFEIPEEYSFSHNVEEPPHNLSYTQTLTSPCPICSRDISVVSLKKHIMSKTKMESDGRVRYRECDHLWYDVWSCPYCHYSNHYLNFFNVLPFNKEQIAKTLHDYQNPTLIKATFMKTPFDHLFLKYIQAIHINEATNQNDMLLIGKLWLSLYWLFDDAGDDKMKLYCAEKACLYLKKAINSNLISDAYSKQSLAFTTATLFHLLGKKDEAVKMCDAAFNGNDGKIKTLAHRLKEGLVYGSILMQ